MRNMMRCGKSITNWFFYRLIRKFVILFFGNTFGAKINGIPYISTPQYYTEPLDSYTEHVKRQENARKNGTGEVFVVTAPIS